MAQQTPDITAILSALAKQQQGTPSQNAPPSMPPGVFPGNGAPPPPNGLGGFQLPTPSSSGSIDLTKITPSSTGNVSLTDAIAKASALAKARGIGERGDRPFSQSRNRSRSPQRGIDSYNPYRDERRDGARRGASGRERSLSPDRSSYSQPLASPPAREGVSSETIVVDSSSVGLIIGRGGDSMRRIEQESGARVQFMQDQSQPRRQCRITGTKRQRADAIAEIFRVASDQDKQGSNSGRQNQNRQQQQPTGVPREGESTTLIWVPDKTVGLVIGRGGETIRDLQEKSGCHVNITGPEKSENGFRPVNLIGTPYAAREARRLIDEIVESDTRGAGPSQDQPRRPDQYGAPAMGGYDPYGAAQGQYGNPYGSGQGAGDGKITDTEMVPSEAVGMIIGKGGETIKDMQSTSGCKINVDQPQGADIERRIELIGNRPAIDEARRLIWEKVQTVRDKQGGSMHRGAQSAGQNGDHMYAQQAQYGQQPPMPQQPVYPVAAAPQGGDEYAAYGGYNNYMALWAAAGGLPHGQQR